MRPGGPVKLAEQAIGIGLTGRAFTKLGFVGALVGGVATGITGTATTGTSSGISSVTTTGGRGARSPVVFT